MGTRFRSLASVCAEFVSNGAGILNWQILSRRTPTISENFENGWMVDYVEDRARARGLSSQYWAYLSQDRAFFQAQY